MSFDGLFDRADRGGIPGPAPDTSAAEVLAGDEALQEITFVIVDLETTGTSARGGDAITEIGAVKVRGGEVLGEFATLVDPERGIAPHVTHLTGITTAMVTGAPTIAAVLPAFLEFSRGAVLVAHNARFDIGFLKAAAQRHRIDWPKPRTLCTVRLARRVLTKDEAPSVKLSELARLFRTDTTPNHRALDDARATVDVLHGLIERVGNQGVHSYRELTDYLPAVTERQRAKRGLADPLPERPGVYLFRGPGDEVLYVGTSVNLRRRVRSYFTAGETRSRIKEMVGLAERVDHVECAHALEAAARELRLIAAHTPGYNRRSKYPRRGWWICLTVEPFPRLAVRRTAAAGSGCLGPVRSRAEAADAADLLADMTGLRSCTTKLARGRTHHCPTIAGDERPLGGCRAAAAEPETAAQYAVRVQRTAALLAGRNDTAVTLLVDRIAALAERESFESAARLRDRLASTVAIVCRSHRLRAFADIAELTIAHPDGAGGWELSVIRHGRLAAAGRAPRGVPPLPVLEMLRAAAETVPPTAPEALFPADCLHGASPEEAMLLRSWALRPGTRIVDLVGTWHEPLCVDRWWEWAERAATAGRDARSAAYSGNRRAA